MACTFEQCAGMVDDHVEWCGWSYLLNSGEVDPDGVFRDNFAIEPVRADAT